MSTQFSVFIIKPDNFVVYSLDDEFGNQCIYNAGSLKLYQPEKITGYSEVEGCVTDQFGVHPFILEDDQGKYKIVYAPLDSQYVYTYDQQLARHNGHKINKGSILMVPDVNNSVIGSQEIQPIPLNSGSDASIQRFIRLSQEGREQDDPQQENPQQENPQQENPQQENPQQTNTQQNNTQQENTKQENPQQNQRRTEEGEKTNGFVTRSSEEDSVKLKEIRSGSNGQGVSQVTVDVNNLPVEDKIDKIPTPVMEVSTSSVNPIGPTQDEGKSEPTESPKKNIRSPSPRVPSGQNERSPTICLDSPQFDNSTLIKRIDTLEDHVEELTELIRAMNQRLYQIYPVNIPDKLKAEGRPVKIITVKDIQTMMKKGEIVQCTLDPMLQAYAGSHRSNNRFLTCRAKNGEIYLVRADYDPTENKINAPK